jgi:hypothetical protein
MADATQEETKEVTQTPEQVVDTTTEIQNEESKKEEPTERK